MYDSNGFGALIHDEDSDDLSYIIGYNPVPEKEAVTWENVQAIYNSVKNKGAKITYLDGPVKREVWVCAEPESMLPDGTLLKDAQGGQVVVLYDYKKRRFVEISPHNITEIKIGKRPHLWI